MTDKVVLVGKDYMECIAFEDVTPVMAARALSPFGCGYGKKKVPTSYKVSYMGRTRRIYADAIGNAGTAYVLVNKEKHFVRG